MHHIMNERVAKVMDVYTFQLTPQYRHEQLLSLACVSIPLAKCRYSSVATRMKAVSSHACANETLCQGTCEQDVG